MVWSAASARALVAASPIASGEPTAIGEGITEWLKITAVPLLVFLIGACIWGCIESTAARRVLTEGGGGSARNEALGEVRSDSPRAISNNEAAEDLETGLELAQVHCRDGRAVVASNEVLVPSLQIRPWMETRPNSDIRNARPNSDIGALLTRSCGWILPCNMMLLNLIPYLCVSALIFGSMCFTVGGVSTWSLRDFFEVATVFIFIVVNL